MDRFLSFLKKGVNQDEVNKLADAIIELKNITDQICDRIDKKMEELKQIEKRVDEKILIYKSILQKSEQPKVSKKTFDKRHEIIRLYESGKGVGEIAKILDIPSGEVELLVNLHKISLSKK